MYTVNLDIAAGEQRLPQSIRHSRRYNTIIAGGMQISDYEICYSRVSLGSVFGQFRFSLGLRVSLGLGLGIGSHVHGIGQGSANILSRGPKNEMISGEPQLLSSRKNIVHISTLFYYT